MALFPRLFARRAPAPPPAEPAAAPLGQVLDAMAEPVLVVADGEVTDANAAARALLGQHIVGEDVRVAIRHPAAAEQLRADVPYGAPVDLVGLGGRGGRWRMLIGPVPDGRRVVQLIDQTAAHAAERARVDFVANASHELRTPLAAILGYVETLREPGGTDPALQQRFLGIIDAEARRMERLVEDLISLSRIESTKYRAPDRVVDLAALIRTVADELRAGARGENLVLDLPDNPAPVLGDAAQLSQLLHNLLTNALKYGRAGTPVTVSLAPDAPGLWRLAVADQGDGVAPEHLPRLTERFFRVDAGRSRAGGGTGLGLAIVKHIVERHRGRLDIASTPGVGTTVTVLLPGVSQNGNGDAA